MQKHLFPLVAIACCLGVQATVSGKEMTCSGEPDSLEKLYHLAAADLPHPCRVHLCLKDP